MSGNIARKLVDLRNRVNFDFTLVHNQEIIRQNEKIAYLDKEVLTFESFVINIGTLALLIEDFDKKVIKSCLRGNHDNKLTNIDLLEKLLEKDDLDGKRICKNLRSLKRIRNNSFPFHRTPTGNLLKALKEIDVKSPYDWNNIWKQCLNVYANALAVLADQLEEYNTKTEYQQRIENQIPKALEKGAQVVYFNDFLYKYRLLLPLDFKHKKDYLVDYLTAAVISYERNLKSIDYALRKYVLPFKKKFTEHKEDWDFVKKRVYLNNGLLVSNKIILQREKTLFKDDKEYTKYYRYIYAVIVAYQMDVTPDWLIKNYWGKGWFEGLQRSKLRSLLD